LTAGIPVPTFELSMLYMTIVICYLTVHWSQYMLPYCSLVTVCYLTVHWSQYMLSYCSLVTVYVTHSI